MIELRPFDAAPAEPAQARIVYKVAATQHDREAAFRLVYEAYRRQEIVPQNRFRMRVTPHHLAPTTDVLIALVRGRAVCTLTLVADCQRGLPMEDVYPDVIARRRTRGVRLGEASSLAVRRSEVERLFPVFVRTTQLMFRCALERGLEQIMIAVHPRHARFYQRVMKFRLIGEQRDYPRVGHQPAVALSIEFDRVRREHPETYRVLFGATLTDEELRPRPMSSGELAYFRPVARLHDETAADFDLGDAALCGATGQIYRRAA